MPDFSPTATRQFQNVGVGNNQLIHDMKWATRAFAAAVIPATTNYFGAAPSADLTVDRYEQGNTLVSSAKIYTIYGIFVQVYAGAGAVFGDFEKLISYTALRIVTAQKEYGIFPLSLLPAGGGVNAQGGNISVTPAAAPGGVSVAGVLNGASGRNSAFTLANPLIIQANQSFYAEILGPITTTQTLTGILNVRVILDGVEQRVAS